MKTTRRATLTAALLAPAIARAQERTAMLQDLARRAAIFLFPYYEMYRTRWNATVNDKNPVRQKLNHFFHVPVLATHRSRAVTTPNTDTLYSTAWLDLSLEPLFLTVPDMGGRYYSFAFMSLSTDNFAYVCRRLDGNRPRPRMIVGPGWKGDAEDGVELVHSPTNGVWLLGRILIDGPPDLESVWTLQSRTLLETPDMRNERRILETQELMRQRALLPPEAVADWPAPNRADPFDLFEVGLRALGESPLGDRDRAAMESFADLRLRPGRKFDARAFSESERSAIQAGMAEAQSEIRAAGRRYGQTVNGWNYPASNLGNFGDDYLYRAHIALTALAALETVEATYLGCTGDETGQPLAGGQRYVLRFEPGQLPPAKSFWSLTLYEVTPEGRAFFIDNPLGRYAIGDRTKGLHTSPDGGLEIFVQHERPTADKESNWLPSPASGPIRLLLRAYEPKSELLDGRYRLPPLRRNS
jgi:hypothetical protein